MLAKQKPSIDPARRENIHPLISAPGGKLCANRAVRLLCLEMELSRLEVADNFYLSKLAARVFGNLAKVRHRLGRNFHQPTGGLVDG